MGRGSGLGGLLAILGLALVLSKGKKPALSASSFNLAGPGPSGSWFYTYREYRDWATDPQAPTEELVTHEAHEGDLSSEGSWRTVNGRIPTPRGGSIPIPRKWPGGTVNVNEMLKSVDEEPPDVVEDPGGPISVNLRLKPVT